MRTVYCIEYSHEMRDGVVTTSPKYTVRGAIARLEGQGYYPEWYEQDRRLPHSFTDGKGGRAFILKEER